MSFLNRWRRSAAFVLALALLGALTPAARAADPYEINTILSLTGPVAFVGKTQLESLKALEAYVNQNGGIAGRPLSFVVNDDASSPANSLQIAQGLVAKHVPLILGPSARTRAPQSAPSSAERSAAAPHRKCRSPADQSYVFLTSSRRKRCSSKWCYLRDRGEEDRVHRLDRRLTRRRARSSKRLSCPRTRACRSSRVSALRHDRPQRRRTDVADESGVPGRCDRWSADAGRTLLRTADGGLDVPTITSPGNLNGLLQAVRVDRPSCTTPAPYYGAAPDQPRGEIGVATGVSVLAGVGAKPDQIEISAWDPAMLLVGALRKLGLTLRRAAASYLVSLGLGRRERRGHDFPALPQRGLARTPSSSSGGIPTGTRPPL